MKQKPSICLTAMRRVASRKGVCVRRHGGVVVVYAPGASGAGGATPERLAWRAAMQRGASAWRALPPERRTQWNRAAERLAPEFRASCGQLTGYTLHAHCAMNCLLCGVALPQTPPLSGRPPRVVDVAVEPDADPRTFRFRVWHRIAGARCARYCVVAAATPAAVRAGRALQKRDRRLICGCHARSAAPLAPSGGELIYDGAQIAVGPGGRFGAWMRIVHLPTGLDSGEAFFELARPAQPGNS